MNFQKIFLSSRIGRGFRGGSDKKMRRMWLGLGIVVVGLPPLFVIILLQNGWQMEFVIFKLICH